MDASGREDRRSHILDAVVRVIIDVGFTNMTIADVAKSAGVSSALVHYHFSSKAELIVAALADVGAVDKVERERIAAAPDDAVARIEAVLCASLPDDADDGTWLLWIETWGETRRNADIRAVMADLDRHENELLVGLVVAGEEAGEFDCSDPHGVVRRLTALRDGLVVEHTLFRPDEPLEGIATQLREAVRSGLGLSTSTV